LHFTDTPLAATNAGKTQRNKLRLLNGL
jgi:hypothetical protein